MKCLYRFFIRKSDCEKLLALINVSKELSSYIKSLYIKEHHTEDYESFFRKLMLNQIYHHIENVQLLANLNKTKFFYISDDRRILAVNIGLEEKNEKDNLILEGVLNNGRYEFRKWICRKHCSHKFDFPNPMILPAEFWEAFKSRDCICSPSGHFLIDHNDRLPETIKREDLLRSLQKSWDRAKNDAKTIYPVIYKDTIQYAFPLYFDDKRDSALVAICQLIEKNADVSRFEVVTKLTKDMVRKNRLLTLFDEEKNSWLNPVSDNNLRERSLVCFEYHKEKRKKIDSFKFALKTLIPIVASTVFLFVKRTKR